MCSSDLGRMGAVYEKLSVRGPMRKPLLVLPARVFFLAKAARTLVTAIPLLATQLVKETTSLTLRERLAPSFVLG